MPSSESLTYPSSSNSCSRNSQEEGDRSLVRGLTSQSLQYSSTPESESIDQDDAMKLWEQDRMGILLGRGEWDALSKRDVPGIIRNYKSWPKCLLVITPRDATNGEDLVVGMVVVESFTSSQDAESYGIDLNKIRCLASKTSTAREWLWTFKHILLFDSYTPISLRSSRINNNRPFLVQEHRLGARVEPPKRAHLRDTARFFLNQLQRQHQENIAGIAHNLRGRTIRVGTTCSGTDICLAVLRHTLDAISGEART